MHCGFTRCPHLRAWSPAAECISLFGTCVPSCVAPRSSAREVRQATATLALTMSIRIEFLPSGPRRLSLIASDWPHGVGATGPTCKNARRSGTAHDEGWASRWRSCRKRAACMTFRHCCSEAALRKSCWRSIRCVVSMAASISSATCTMSSGTTVT